MNIAQNVNGFLTFAVAKEGSFTRAAAKRPS
jgi:hypothetical protein